MHQAGLNWFIKATTNYASKWIAHVILRYEYKVMEISIVAAKNPLYPLG